MEKSGRGGPLTTLLEMYLGNRKYTFLNVAKEELGDIGPEIGLVTQLETLALQDSQITSLPPEIGRLTRLKTLTLSGNNLTQIPIEIHLLSNLTALNLSHNKLTYVPDELTRMTSLIKLYLSHNELTTLPPSFSRLTSLQALALQNNHSLIIPWSLQSFCTNLPQSQMASPVLGPRDRKADWQPERKLWWCGHSPRSLLDICLEEVANVLDEQEREEEERRMNEEEEEEHEEREKKAGEEKKEEEEEVCIPSELMELLDDRWRWQRCTGCNRLLKRPRLEGVMLWEDGWWGVFYCGYQCFCFI